MRDGYHCFVIMTAYMYYQNDTRLVSSDKPRSIKNPEKVQKKTLILSH